MIIMFFFQSVIFAQEIVIKGKLISQNTQQILRDASVSIQGTQWTTISDLEGIFELKGEFPPGEQQLTIVLLGYVTKAFPIIIGLESTIDLGEIALNTDAKVNETYFATIDLNNEQDVDGDNLSQNQTLLQANRDPFLSSVAFNWSSTFYRLRGLGNEYSKVLLNGTEMNSFFNKKPNWSNWSGLNDMLRTQEATAYGRENNQTFGGLTGVNQLQFDAFKYRKGSKVSFASTSKTYKGRLMATIHSGQLLNGWAYSVSASLSRGEEGFIEGTSIRNYSLIGSISKKINRNHRVNFTALFTPVERGKSSPNTQEVIDIKGQKYNSYWGIQNGEIRNSRIKKVKEPIFTLNHFWKLNSKIDLQNNLLFQTGTVTNSRLDFNGKEISSSSQIDGAIFNGTSRNPDPTYYQRLPSFFLRNKNEEDFESAFKANRALKENGQLDWRDLYARNQTTTTAVNILYDDVVANTFLGLNSIWNYELSSSVSIQGKVSYRNLKSENYASIVDLLGASGYLDIDGFSEGNKAQNNLRDSNRIVVKGDRFRYNYKLKAINFNSFLQARFSIPKWELYSAISVENTKYQREGLFENGNYQGKSSFGNSQELNFTGYGIKLGAVRQLSHKLYFSSSVNLIDTPPTTRQSFSNPRQNNDVVIGLKNENQLMLDGTFNYQFGKILARLSGYYIRRKDLTGVSFFFTENIAELDRLDNSAFVQEITTGIKTLNTGVEFGVEIQATNTLAINMSLAYGKHIYVNNPNLYITSDSFQSPLFLGESKLKNYRLSNGPQQAFGLGFNYRNPSYWWFSTQLNYLSNAYINISPFTRTQNFAADIDGQPLLDYDETRARELLRQEEFEGYFLWNAIGGKSWRLKHKNYIGFTLGVQNILNQIFKTGGFEQSRNSNYRDLNEDRSRENPLFGNKYWQGYGTTFYLNTYWRF